MIYVLNTYNTKIRGVDEYNTLARIVAEFIMQITDDDSEHTNPEWYLKVIDIEAKTVKDIIKIAY